MTSGTARSASSDTHVVELTPPGRGAVSVVLVAGPDAQRAVNSCFHAASGRPLGESALGRILLGRWGGPGGEEIVACRRSAEQIEIHCHGGLAAVNAVIDRLLEQGCQRISWQDWLRRSTHDSIRAAAAIALAEAPTARTAAVLLDQYHGALRCAIQHVVSSIAANEWPRAAAAVDAVRAYRNVGLHLTTPWRVVLAGRTNVGKSSLINALAGFERAIVSHQPGTTRDVVTTLTAIDGWPVELADTAGLRRAEDELESAGIALAAAEMAAADLVVIVHDATPHRLSDLGRAGEGCFDLGPNNFLPQVPSATRILEVLNKIDLLDAAGLRSAAGFSHAFGRRGGSQETPVLTSALTGAGIGDLVTRIGRRLVPNAPPAGAAVPFFLEHFEAFDAARNAIRQRDTSAAMAALQPLLAS